MTKDEWIQQAKGLLFDCIFSVDSKCLKREINALLERGGGYDASVETPTSSLVWPTNEKD